MAWIVDVVVHCCVGEERERERTWTNFAYMYRCVASTLAILLLLVVSSGDNMYIESAGRRAKTGCCCGIGSRKLRLLT